MPLMRRSRGICAVSLMMIAWLCVRGSGGGEKGRGPEGGEKGRGLEGGGGERGPAKGRRSGGNCALLLEETVLVRCCSACQGAHVPTLRLELTPDVCRNCSGGLRLPRRGCAPGSVVFEVVKIDSHPDSVHSKKNKAEKRQAKKKKTESAPAAADAAPAATDAWRKMAPESPEEEEKAQAALKASVEEAEDARPASVVTSRAETPGKMPKARHYI